MGGRLSTYRLPHPPNVAGRARARPAEAALISSPNALREPARWRRCGSGAGSGASARRIWRCWRRGRSFALLSERMTVGPAGGAPRATRTSRAYATSSPALALAMASLSCEESRGPVPCGIDPIQCSSAQVRSRCRNSRGSPGALRRHPSRRRRMDWLRDLVLPGTNWCGTGCCGYDPQRYNTCATGTLDSACRLHDHCRAVYDLHGIANFTDCACDHELYFKTPATTCSSHRSTDPRASGRASIRAASCAWVRRDTTMRLARTRHTCHCLARSATWTNSIATCATTRRGGGGRRCWGGRRRRVAVDRSALTSASTSVGLVWYAPRCGGNS